MSFSKESRFRNVVTTGEYRRGGTALPMNVLVGVVGLVLVLCCCGAGLLIGLQVGGGGAKLQQTVSSALTPATPTPDRASVVPFRSKGLMDNGLELMVIDVQRPLKIEGAVKLPADQQFMLVTVQITNTKKTGTPIKVVAADFTLKGDGGLTYEANPPKTVTMPNMLTEVNIAAAKKVESELIFQIATNDTGLKLNWKVGARTRQFLLGKAAE